MLRFFYIFAIRLNFKNKIVMARLTPGPGKKIIKKKPAKSPGSAVISGFKKMGEAVKKATSSKKLRKGTSGEAAGVVSRTGGVYNLSESRVKGSRQAGIESLKAKRKSGEMSRQEANAKINALKQGGKKKGKAPVAPAVKVKAKRQDRFSYFTKDENIGMDKKLEGKQFRAQVAKTKLPSDSMAYFSKLGEFNPRAAEGTRKSMAQIQQAYKERYPNATFTYGKGVSGEPLLTAQLNTPKKKMSAAQVSAYERLKTRGKDPESVRTTLGLPKRKK